MLFVKWLKNSILPAMQRTLKMTVNAIFRSYSKIANTEKPNTEKQDIAADIKKISQNLENAYNRFDFESDDTLIEASIYEIEALKARYRYLLQAAKNIEKQPESEDIFSIESRLAE